MSFVEELEVLQEIYCDELILEGQHKFSIDIKSFVGDDDNNKQIEQKVCNLRVEIPKTYPMSDPPVILKLSNFDSQVVNELYGLFQPGEIVLFMWIEHIREKLLEIQNEENSVKFKTDNGMKEEEEEERFQQLDVTHNMDLNKLEIFHGDPETSRKSTFQAHLVPCEDVETVEQFVNQLKLDRKIAKATHNILAYRIERKDKPGFFICDNDDDGENAAGSRLAHLLDILDARNVAVIVTRWYGGIQLGPSRFKFINNVARELLIKHNYDKKM